MTDVDVNKYVFKELKGKNIIIGENNIFLNITNYISNKFYEELDNMIDKYLKKAAKRDIYFEKKELFSINDLKNDLKSESKRFVDFCIIENSDLDKVVLEKIFLLFIKSSEYNIIESIITSKIKNDKLNLPDIKSLDESFKKCLSLYSDIYLKLNSKEIDKIKKQEDYENKLKNYYNNLNNKTVNIKIHLYIQDLVLTLRKKYNPQFNFDYIIFNNFTSYQLNNLKILDWAGIKGASEISIDLDSLYTTLSLFINIPPGDLPRISRKDPLESENRIISYQKAYQTSAPISSDNIYDIKDKRNFIILGLPGSGKTTFSKFNCRKMLMMFNKYKPHDKNIHYPIYIQLRDLSIENNIEESILKYIEINYNFKIYSTTFKNYLNNGKIALFFDGLDEIVDIGKRNQVVKRIRDLAENYQKCYYTITCRIAAYREIYEDTKIFEKYMFDEMNEIQRSSFLHNLYKQRYKLFNRDNPERAANLLIKEINKSDRLEMLSKNPLLLTIMSLIYSDIGYIPKSRSELYEECVKVLFERRDLARTIKIKTELEDVNPYFVIERLAYNIHEEIEQKGLSSFELTELQLIEKITVIIIEGLKITMLPQIEEIRHSKVPEFVRIIRERSGVILDRGLGRFGFVHLTFQEYFSARYLYLLATLSKLKVWYILYKKINSNHWFEVILLFFDIMTQKNILLCDYFIDKMLKFEGISTNIQRVLFSVKIVFRDIPLSMKSKRKIVDTLENLISIFNLQKCIHFELLTYLAGFYRYGLMEHIIEYSIFLIREANTNFETCYKGLKIISEILDEIYKLKLDSVKLNMDHILYKYGFFQLVKSDVYFFNVILVHAGLSIGIKQLYEQLYPEIQKNLLKVKIDFTKEDINDISNQIFTDMCVKIKETEINKLENFRHSSYLAQIIKKSINYVLDI